MGFSEFHVNVCGPYCEGHLSFCRVSWGHTFTMVLHWKGAIKTDYKITELQQPVNMWSLHLQNVMEYT